METFEAVRIWFLSLEVMLEHMTMQSITKNSISFKPFLCNGDVLHFKWINSMHIYIISTILGIAAIFPVEISDPKYWQKEMSLFSPYHFTENIIPLM